LFYRRLRKVNQGAGGLYFKSRAGEEIVRHLNDQLIEMFTRGSVDVRIRLGPVVKNLDPDTNLAEFRVKLEADETKASHAEAFADFQTALGDSAAQERILQVLGAFRAVLSYEVNRPYENWYGRREVLEVQQEEERVIRQIIGNRATGGQSLDDYISEGKNPSEPLKGH
jgi:hypothetical protein